MKERFSPPELPFLGRHEHYSMRIVDTLSQQPGRDALWWRGQRISAGRFRSLICAAARTMRDQGIGRGDIVAILTASNSPDMLITRYAVNLIGAAAIHLRSINAASSAEMLPIEPQLQILRETSARLLATDSPSLSRAIEIRADLNSPLVLAAVADLGPEAVDLTASGGDDAPPDPPAVAADDLAIITYTSGTTGQPKGICRSFRAWGQAVSTTEFPEREPRILVTTPLSHTVGPMVDAVLVSGGTIFLQEGFDPGEMLSSIARHRITRVFVAAPQIYQLLDHPARKFADFSSLRQIIYGGTSASPRRLGQAVRAFGPVLVQTYGTTETWEIGTLSQREHLDPALLGTSGRQSPAARVVIRDPDNDQELPPGAVGEVCVQSPGMLTCYWKDEELTARALRGGWFHSGDLGYYDQVGYIHLVGRIADVIKYSGVKVYPIEVENALLEHPGIAQAVVCGVRDSDDVEWVTAAVVLRPGWQVTADEVRAQAAGQLSQLHAPAVVTFREAMPLAGSGKPDKKLLRAEALASLAQRRDGERNSGSPAD